MKEGIIWRRLHHHHGDKTGERRAEKPEITINIEAFHLYFCLFYLCGNFEVVFSCCHSFFFSNKIFVFLTHLKCRQKYQYAIEKMYIFMLEIVTEK